MAPPLPACLVPTRAGLTLALCLSLDVGARQLCLKGKGPGHSPAEVVSGAADSLRVRRHRWLCPSSSARPRLPRDLAPLPSLAACTRAAHTVPRTRATAPACECPSCHCPLPRESLSRCLLSPETPSPSLHGSPRRFPGLR